MSINRRVDKEDVVHIYNGLLLRHKKKQCFAIYRDMSGPRGDHTDEVRKREKIYIIA